MAAVIIRKKDVEQLGKELIKKYLTFYMMSINSKIL